MKPAATDLIVLGGPASGKTHYGGQLYGRVMDVVDSDRPPALTLREGEGPPPDLSVFDEVLDALSEGRTAGHTPTESWGEMCLPLRDAGGRALDLTWPDYGGEQVRSMMTEREIPEAWRDRLTGARGWLVLIRLDQHTTYPDALADLDARRGETGRPTVHVERQTRWDANAWWVEFFQLLLHVAGHGTARRVDGPPLAIVLSCYDELKAADGRPDTVLARKLPLLARFIESSWAADQWSVWGLSALGRALGPDSEDPAFIDEGPEVQGYVVDPGGGPGDPDLTRPLAWLLERM